MEESNFNSVKEMILDESKLVTYVSISKDLCMHVNESKSLLTQIVRDLRKEQPDINLNVSYIISGLAEKNKAVTTVCSESDLDAVKQALTLVFFQHVYSVGKGHAAVDEVAYMAINRFQDFTLCTGLIKNNTCTKRTGDEIGNLKSNSQELLVPDTKTTIVPKKKVKEEITSKAVSVEIPKNSPSESKITNKVNGEIKSVAKIHETKSEPIVKVETPSPKSEKKNQTKSQKGIAGFFSKSNSVPAKKSKIDTVKDKAQSERIEKKVEENVQVKEEKMDVDEISTTVAKKVVNNKPKPAKSLTDIKKNGKVEKKRKRVLHVSDSESDEEKNDPFADDRPVTKETIDSDDEIPPTPTANTVKITSGIVNPKKRRKIVDKTYTDDEGYILTKKEEVYESCSENEDCESKENVKQTNQVKVEVKVEVSPTKKNGTKKTKKISPPQKGKQATLMNFFKKV